MADMNEYLKDQLAGLKEQGLYKAERVIQSQQSADIEVSDGSEVINFCAVLSCL